MTFDEFAERFDDGVNALQSIAAFLEAIERVLAGIMTLIERAVIGRPPAL